MQSTTNLGLNKPEDTDVIDEQLFLAQNFDKIDEKFGILSKVAVNVLSYGADPTGATDSSTAIQNAHNDAGIGAVIFYPKGKYKVNGTITMQAGQKVKGTGWSTIVGQNAVQDGSQIVQYSTSDIPLFQCLGSDDAHQQERGGFQDIALVNNVLGSTVGTAINVKNARQWMLENVYITSFNTGINQLENCWQWTLKNVRIFDANTCLIADSACEDSTYISCVFRPYRTNSYGVILKNQSQTNLFLGCDISNCSTAIWMQQGDSAGNGTGTPYAMHATFINCQFEDPTTRVFYLTSSNANANNQYHPGLTVIGCRTYVYTNPNTGQIFVEANQASQIKVETLTGSGHSWGLKCGATVGVAQWNNNKAMILGSGVATGATTAVSITPGNHPLCLMTSGALNYTATQYTKIPFNVVTSDYWNWYDPTNVIITPKRNQLVKIKMKVVIDSANAGDYTLIIKKSNVDWKSFSAYQATTGKPLVMETEFYDTPNGTNDYYSITVNSSASFALNASSSYFLVEVCGN